MINILPIPSSIIYTSETYEEFFYRVMKWIVETQLSRNQKTRLFGFTTYKDITHDLYYHLGMYFKKRMLFLKGQARKQLFQAQLDKLLGQQRFVPTASINEAVQKELQDRTLQALIDQGITQPDEDDIRDMAKEVAESKEFIAYLKRTYPMQIEIARLDDRLQGYARVVDRDGDIDIQDYTAYKQAKAMYHTVWRLIRGNTQGAHVLRSAVVKVAKEIQYGNFLPEPSESLQDKIVTDLLAGKGEFDYDDDSPNW